MEARRIRVLAGLPDERMFKEIAEGLMLIHEHAVRLWESVPVLVDQEHYRVAQIIRNLAEEEAAKYLILLDAVRCPGRDKRLSRHLGKFNAHLARGIYADLCAWRPADLKEIRKGIERECAAYYLDGPNDVDWIFRNNTLSEREDAMYVDYVQSDDGYCWTSPQSREALTSAFLAGMEPCALRLVRALDAFGFAKPEALHVIARIWRCKAFTDETRYVELRAVIVETLDALNDEGLAENIAPEICGLIAEQWPFPLYDFAIEQTGRDDKARLREIQGSWAPPI